MSQRVPSESDRAIRARLVRTYENATRAERAAGLEWYAVAERAAERIGAEHGLDKRHAAGIIAALSPRQTWRQNVRAAERIAAEAAAGAAEAPRVGLGDAVAKAWRIAHGEDPADVLGGPKVRAFFANIVGDWNAVTVDVWASRAAYGRKDAPVPAGRTYDRLAEHYRAAARRVGVSPRDFQAAVWVHVRGAAQ